ncbi:NACHT domain-containing protein [Aliarcobacter butzleri]|uniref:NACHT domain-containing protein n=1 Tax=Aliarcobacter butzleri TaxID=28197 RepID=UPI003AF4C3C5
MCDFIQRRFLDTKENKIIAFKDLLSNNISVILGEPASGKTEQLKQFEKENSDDAHFVELVNIETQNNLELIRNKKYILLDSIDEALRVNNINSKELQNKLTSYIQKCQKMNPEIKFAITCRQFEWKEYFNNELKKLDKEFIIYQILDLEKDDINELLKQNKINQDEFWKYISDNFLDSLLKNILIVQSIIKNYNEYKTKAITYIDIYIDIIKQQLSIKGKDREDTLSKDLAKDMNISSSLATYMILNRKATISIDNLSLLADELYKIDNKNISFDELNVVLSTSLFKKDSNEFDFSHTSIKEFLMAHFINEKKLDSQTIKNFFSYKLRFYEEFEEIIVYLTNLNSDLFDNFVKFDPFIFKRHPNLNNQEQEKLLASMLYKLKKDKSMAWSRWRDFENTTLVKFDKLKLSTLIQKHIKSSDIDNVVFPYLIALLEYNYSKDMEDLIFIYLEDYSNNNLSSNKEHNEITDSKFEGNKKLRKLIEDNYIDNFNFNKRLFEFLKNKKLLNTNKQKISISIMDLEVELFESLYGIKYTNRYGSNKKADFIDTGFQFDKLLELLDAIPIRQLEYIVPYLKPMDTLKWLDYVELKQDRENYHINCWCIYAVLLHNNSKNSIEKVFEFIATHFCSIDNREFDEMSLDFERIADNFWEVYFSAELDTFFYIDSLLKLLRISLDDVKKTVLKYPIEKYLEHYIKFRLDKDIDEFLMQNSTFNSYMNDLWKKQKEQQEKWDEEYKNKYETTENIKKIELIKQLKANDEKICEESLKSLATKQDFYNVFTCEEIYEEANQNKLHELFTEEEHEKLLNFIEDDFIKDKTYIEIKKRITSNSYSVFPTALYIYLFHNIDNNKASNLIQSKEDFEKIFFHTFVFHKIKEQYFSLLVSEYFDYFIVSILELIKLSLKENENKDLISLSEFIEVIQKVGKFDKNNLSKLIQNLLDLDKNIFESITEKYKVEEILKIISLDERSYDFINELGIIDKDRVFLYLEYLLKIDSKVTLDKYFIEYQKEPTYIKFYKLKKLYLDIKNKLGIKIKDNDDKNKFDRPNINQSKIKLFKDLMLALKNSLKNEDLEDKYIFNIISDYYEFFYEYERPTGVYSPNTYSAMNEYINSILNYLSATSSHIEVLEKLSKSINIRLVNISKYHLQLAYNNKNKDRNYPNSYYKKIFDKESIVNNSKITKLKNKWGELTMFEKIGAIGSVASIVGLVLYFMPTSSSSNNINVNNNNQSPIIQENHGNIIYNIDNSKNQTTNNNIEISNKIDNLINVTSMNIKGKNQEEQKNINTKIFILGEAKKINEKDIPLNAKNNECKNQAINAKNLLNHNADVMNQICDEIFQNK